MSIPTGPRPGGSARPPQFSPRHCAAVSVLIAGLAGWPLCGSAAGAADAVPDPGIGVYVEHGRARHSGGRNDATTLGVSIPMRALTDWTERPLQLGVDVFASQWRPEHPPAGRGSSVAQAGIAASLRYPLGGAGPWFAEGALGATLLEHHYRNGERRFSTKFQFNEQLALGRAFGDRRHELSLRLQHFSNGGIRQPNPGETLLYLRYLYRP